MARSGWQWVYTITEVSDFSPQTALLRVAYPYPYVRNDGTVDKTQHVRWLPPPPPSPQHQQQHTNSQWRSARIGANHSRSTDMFDNDWCVSAGVVPVQVSAHVPRKTIANIYTLGIEKKRLQLPSDIHIIIFHLHAFIASYQQYLHADSSDMLPS